MACGWRQRAIACVLLGAALGAAGPILAKPVLVDGGLIEGEASDDLNIYRGVPFAAPPLASLRWKPPQPVKPWDGIRSAKVFAPACMQQGVSMPGESPPPTSEDCLYLNIWALRNTTGARPVIVWIHGGGWTNGSASMPLYWGDSLARRGAVVVAIAYRLGPFGFLAHPELTDESPHRSSGNYGLADQIAALQWVRRNISLFGGDPQNITIAGQSSGGMAVSILLASPRAKDLFHRAIGQSGGLFEPTEIAPHYLLANAEKDGLSYAASVNAKSLDDLRRLPAHALLGEGAARISHPIIEPEILPQSPYEAFHGSRHADVPTLVGYNVDEARSLTDLAPITTENFAELLRNRWGPLPPPLMAAYPFTTNDEAKAARASLERDLRFGWDMWTWSRLQARSGKAPLYSYLFTQKPPFPEGSVYSGWGAAHFAELWYMFGHLDQQQWAWSQADRALTDIMASYWVNFARTGNPNGPGLPLWPRFTSNAQQVLHLGKKIEIGTVPNRDALVIFDQVYARLRGETPQPDPTSLR